MENDIAVRFVDERLNDAWEVHEATGEPIKPSLILEQFFDTILSPNPEVWPAGTDNMSACLIVFKNTAVDEPKPKGMLDAFTKIFKF